MLFLVYVRHMIFRIDHYNYFLLLFLQVGVECADEGHPPLSTRAVIPVVVADVNDNAPSFVTSLYVVSIAENNQPDANIVQVLWPPYLGL